MRFVIVTYVLCTTEVLQAVTIGRAVFLGSQSPSNCWLYSFSEMTEMQRITLILEAVLNLLFQGHLTQLLLGADRQERDYDCE